MKAMWVGFAFFVAILILGFGSLLVGPDFNPFKQRMTLRVHFERIPGLREGDDVRVDGLLYGRVKDIKLGDQGVDVMLILDEPITIFRDGKVEVEPSSVLGGSVVSITRGKGPDPLDLSQPVAGRVLGGISELGPVIEKLNPVIDNLRDITENLVKGKGTIPRLLNEDTLHKEMVATLKTAQETAAEIKKVGENVNKVVDKLDKGKGPIPTLLNDEKMTQKIDKTLDNIEKASANIADLTKKVESGPGLLGRAINDKEMGDQFKSLIQKMEKSADHIERITGTLDDKIVNGNGTLGKIVQDDELYEKARQAVDDIDKVLGRAARAVVEIVGESKTFDESEMTVSKLGIRIRLSGDKNFNADVPEDKYLFAGAAFLSLDPDGDIAFERQITDNESDTIIKPEIYLAYRVPWFLDRRLTVRAGFIEGKPGGAIDFLWEDWLFIQHPVQFTLEIRDSYNDLSDEDIDEGIHGPLVRAWAKMPLWTGRDSWPELLLSTVRVYGGFSRIGDDPEGFIGIGLEWPDEDIRSLISLIGLAR